MLYSRFEDYVRSILYMVLRLWQHCMYMLDGGLNLSFSSSITSSWYWSIMEWMKNVEKHCLRPVMIILNFTLTKKNTYQFLQVQEYSMKITVTGSNPSCNYHFYFTDRYTVSINLRRTNQWPHFKSHWWTIKIIILYYKTSVLDIPFGGQQFFSNNIIL